MGGLIDKIVGHTNERGNVMQDTNINKVELTVDEIDVIIGVLASASFPVKDIESLYKAILKLQELRKK